MKYPRIDRNDKISVKMTISKIISAKQLYESGWAIGRISKKFEVAWITIAVYVDPKYFNYYKNKYRRLGVKRSPNHKENAHRFNKRRKDYKRKEFLKYKRGEARKQKDITPDRWRINQPSKIKNRLEKERSEKMRAYYRKWQRKYRKTKKYKEWQKAYYDKQDKSELARKAREWRKKHEK